eukprot:2496976-Pleurochrysis_carterae.AAC.3
MTACCVRICSRSAEAHGHQGAVGHELAQQRADLSEQERAQAGDRQGLLRACAAALGAQD